MIKPILIWPNSLLKKKSIPVGDSEFGTDDFNQLVTDMWDTLYDSGGVGLAAIQIGVPKRVFVMDTGNNKVCWVFVNPLIMKLEGELSCLSLPGVIETIFRSPSVSLIAQDEDGGEFESEHKGLDGQCVQHEYDHLDGVMMPDKMTPMQLAKVKRKFKK